MLGGCSKSPTALLSLALDRLVSEPSVSNLLEQGGGSSTVDQRRNWPKTLRYENGALHMTCNSLILLALPTGFEPVLQP
jgi:hypothetical protein